MAAQIQEVGPPPTTEKGTAGSIGGVIPAWGQLSTFIDFDEESPDVQWPQSVQVWDRVGNDGQVKGLQMGTILPLLRFRWYLDPNGADPKQVQKISTDYGIPIKGEPIEYRPRLRNRFNFKRHQMDAFRALTFGHYYFEQVGVIGEDGLWHIKKLAPRRPKSIMEIDVAEDGGLKGIKQAMGPIAPTIPVSQLVAYIWDQEAGNWVGKSMLRALYRNWLIKDVLMRVDAIKHERTSAGTPVVTAPQDATPDEILALDAFAQKFRAGENAGGAIPFGSKLDLTSISGFTADTVGSMNYHNEEMARSFLMMFLQLGSTEHGSRALGADFIEFFAYAQEAIADWFCEVFNEHVIEDDIDWNFKGPNGESVEQVPLLCYDRASEEDLPTSDLAMLIDKGAVVVDKELEEWIRQKYKMPERDPNYTPPTPPTPPDPAPPPSPAAAGGGRRSTRTQPQLEGDPPSTLQLPDRDLRRQPYDHEILASVNFAALEDIMVSATDELETEIKVIQKGQIQQLHDMIVEAAGDEVELAKLEADPLFEETLFAKMQDVADQGMQEAVAEAKAQGVDVSVPDMLDLEDSIQSRAKAMDTVLTRSLSEAASRQALKRTGGSLSAEEVASQVKEHLEGLKGTYLHDQLNGTLNQAMNSGRKITMRENKAEKVYASELLDENTCAACETVDGTEYETLDDAEADYPGGGFAECEGDVRCRGTLVGVY